MILLWILGKKLLLGKINKIIKETSTTRRKKRRKRKCRLKIIYTQQTMFKE